MAAPSKWSLKLNPQRPPRDREGPSHHRQGDGHRADPHRHCRMRWISPAAEKDWIARIARLGAAARGRLRRARRSRSEAPCIASSIRTMGAFTGVA